VLAARPKFRGEVEMSELDEFARRLMQLVRDRAVVACDALIAGGIAGPQGDNWRELGRPVGEALQALVPDVVDQVLFEFLAAIDGGELPMSWRDSSGAQQDMEDLGSSEMAGWLMMGAGGWRDRYSMQRFNDYTAGLRLDIDWNSQDD
jgi:hypothetical protein